MSDEQSDINWLVGCLNDAHYLLEHLGEARERVGRVKEELSHKEAARKFANTAASDIEESLMRSQEECLTLRQRLEELKRKHQYEMMCPSNSLYLACHCKPPAGEGSG